MSPQQSHDLQEDPQYSTCFDDELELELWCDRCDSDDCRCDADADPHTQHGETA